MHIASIEIFYLSRPLLAPFRTAAFEQTSNETLLVRLCDGEQSGWSETTPLMYPGYSPECASGVFHIASKFMAPLLLGKNIESGAQLQQLLSPIKANYFAKAGFDMAWWDLQARRENQPLWKRLGGQSDVAKVGADFGILDSIDELLQCIDGAVQRGFPRIKLKYRPGWEIEMLREVRRAFPDTVFHVDCNSAYTLDDLPMLRQLDDFNLAMIEQPLMSDDLIDHAKLQKQISTPICLDESITSLSKARKAIEIGACRWINIKPGRVGGTTNALAVCEYSQSQNVPCWIGGMFESAIGAMHCQALATLPNMKYAADIFTTADFYPEELTAQPVTLSAPGEIRAFAGAGIGIEPDARQVEKVLLQRAQFEP